MSLETSPIVPSANAYTSRDLNICAITYREKNAPVVACVARIERSGWQCFPGAGSVGLALG